MIYQVCTVVENIGFKRVRRFAHARTSVRAMLLNKHETIHHDRLGQTPKGPGVTINVREMLIVKTIDNVHENY